MSVNSIVHAALSSLQLVNWQLKSLPSSSFLLWLHCLIHATDPVDDQGSQSPLQGLLLLCLGRRSSRETKETCTIQEPPPPPSHLPQLSQRVDIVVASPGRLLQHIAQVWHSPLVPSPLSFSLTLDRGTSLSPMCGI
jgi:hypothetical protein